MIVVCTSMGSLLTGAADFTPFLFYFIFFRVHNEACASCDIVSQRMFRGGRTEYIRSPTNQTLMFILAFNDPSVSVRKVTELFYCGFISACWVVFR